jgi:hypothetical protein
MTMNVVVVVSAGVVIFELVVELPIGEPPCDAS